MSVGKRKVHYTFEDKTEMAEDYSVQTGELLGRFCCGAVCEIS